MKAIKLGGGHYECPNCGKTIFGSVLHECKNKPKRIECSNCDRTTCEGCPHEEEPEPIDFGDDERTWGYDGDAL